MPSRGRRSPGRLRVRAAADLRRAARAPAAGGPSGHCFAARTAPCRAATGGRHAGEVRRLGAWEVGLPALAGGFLGYLVFGVLRAMFGGRSAGADFGNGGIDSEVARAPGAEHGALGVVARPAGRRLRGTRRCARGRHRFAVASSSHRSASPAGHRVAPRPWGALLMMVGFSLLAASGSTRSSLASCPPSPAWPRCSSSACSDWPPGSPIGSAGVWPLDRPRCPC